MLISSRNVLLLGACCTSTTHGFSTPYASITLKSSLKNSYLDSIGPNEDRRPPMPIPGAPPPPPIGQFEDPPYIDLDGRVMDRQSNLFFRMDPNYQSINEDPRQFDMERRSVHLYHVTTSCGCTLGVNLSEMNAEITMTKNKLLHRDLDARNHLNIEGTVIPLGGLLAWPFYWMSSFGCVWAMKLTNLLSE